MKIQAVNQLLEKEVSRKEFLKSAGIILLSIVGVTGMLKAISSLGENKQQKQGFGKGPYGA